MSNDKTHPKAPSALLVDFDGVIRHWPSDDSDVEKECGLPLGSLRRVAFSDRLLLPAILGVASDGLWREQIAEELRCQYPQARVSEAVERWSGRVGTIDKDVLQVIQQCRRTMKVVLATNATSRLAQDLKGEGLSGRFDAVANSSELGAIKPTPQFYVAALELVKTQASDALFIDDSASNVSAAREQGIRAHQFAGLAGMIEFLEATGAVRSGTASQCGQG